MHLIDWLILTIYFLITLFIGFWLSARNKTEVDYFVAGRRLNGWLAGASMAATTFSIDTPLYVAGIIGARGLAGNWEWWSFGLAHVAMTVVFAPMWRRSGVLTDAAFTELRYGGLAAAWLRGSKAFLLSVPINCIGIGYAFLALRKVAEALEVVQGRVIFANITDTLLLMVVVACLLLIYTVFGGLWAVIVNDLFQLLIAIVGAFILTFTVLRATGGMNELIEQVNSLNRPELLSFFPWTWNKSGIQWIKETGISVSTFASFMTLQWWSFRRSDGGGEFIQRMLSTKDESQAYIAGWVFLIINYLVRSWLWIIVAFGGLVLLPMQVDWEMSYPSLAVKYLPPFALGIVVVSLVAAFMSTLSTSLNWGASYLTHDLYQRFIRPKATKRELIFVGQLTSIMILIFGIFTALISDSIGSVFRLVIAIGTGPGVVLVLRWFWWRVNAQAELSAMISGFLIGLMTSIFPSLRIDDYGIRLITTTVLTGFIWIAVLILTPPESNEVLENFVSIVKPPGPGWRALRQKIGVKPVDDLEILFLRFLFGSGLLFGALLSLGGFLMHQQLLAWSSLLVAVFCLLLIRKKYVALYF